MDVLIDNHDHQGCGNEASVLKGTVEAWASSRKPQRGKDPDRFAHILKSLPYASMSDR
jgi:hypothetical protein